MTETAWHKGRSLESLVRLACGGFVVRTLRTVLGMPYRSRKMRLLLCACSRSHWPADSRVQTAVEVVERFVDGCAGRSAFSRAYEMVTQVQNEWGDWPDPATDSAHAALSWFAPAPDVVFAVMKGVVTWTPDEKCVHHGAELFFDVVGNLFQPAAAQASWRSPAVMALAETAYAVRPAPSGHLDPDRLGVLADALEDADCDNTDLLAHFRSPGPHVRGCWALDVILGKQ